MIDIQFPTAEITARDKKERRRKKKETAGQKYNGLPQLFHRAAMINTYKTSNNRHW